MATTRPMSRRSRRANASEPAGLVDHIAQRLPCQEAAAIIGNNVVAALVKVRPVAGRVRRDQHARHGPQRMIGRQRLLLEHIERSAGDLAGVQRATRSSRRVVMPRPMLMKKALALHALKLGAIHQAFCCRGMRNCQHDEIRARQQ